MQDRSLLDWLRNHTTATPDQVALLATQRPTYPLAFALAASATGARHAALDMNCNRNTIQR